MSDSRVFEYDLQTMKLTKVLSGLRFANSVQLNRDETQLMVTETFGHRIVFYDVATWRETKVVRLPGMWLD